MKKLFFLILLLCVSSLSSADVEVVIEGFDEAKGQVLVGFFQKAEDFQVNPIPQSPKAVIEEELVKEGGIVTVTAKDLEPGVYAIAVIWDLNMNDILDKKGVFNMPIEPYGFSNNPRTTFGPPKFEDCTFIVPEGGGTIKILLVP